MNTERASGALFYSLILLGIWLILNLLPFVLVPEFLLDFSMQHNKQGGSYLVLLFFSLILIFALEGLIFISLFSWAKGPGIFRKLAATGIFFLIAAYYSAIIGSWYVYTKLGVFVGPDSLSLLTFFADLKTFLTATTQSDLFRILSVFAAAAAVSLLLWAFSGAACSGGALLRRWVVIGLAVLGLVLLPKLLIGRLDNERKLYYASLVNNFFAPQFSYIWGPLWFGAPHGEYQTTDLQLEKRYGMGEYLSRTGQKNDRNVLLIMIEALRSDVVGQGIMTEIDRLASEGLYFKHAYSDGNETCYGQAAVLTGLYQLKFPYRDMRRDLEYPFLRIYDILSQVGYNTAYFTQEWATTRKVTASPFLGLRVDPENISFEEISKLVPEAEKDLLTPATIDRYNTARFKNWLPDKSPGAKPWFATIYFYASHYPYDRPANFQEKFAPNRLPETESVSFLNYPKEYAPIMRNRYYNTLGFIDGLLGELLRDISAKGHLDNTVVIITGDHGELFHEHGLVGHGRELYEEAVKVPLIIGGKIGTGHQARLDEAVSQIDIAPTVLDIAGLPPHDNFQGRSVLSKEEDSGNKIFSSVQLMIQEDCIVSLPFKYCFNRRQNTERLFNVIDDPKEAKNLLLSEPATVNSLRSELSDFRNKQLTYYDRKNRFREDYFPPKW